MDSFLYKIRLNTMHMNFTTLPCNEVMNFIISQKYSNFLLKSTDASKIYRAYQK